MDVDLGATTVSEDVRLAALGWLARGMERQPDLETTLQAVVHQARRADLSDAVSVLIIKGRKIAVGAVSDPEVGRADELQLECSQGPGVESILTRRNFVSDDLRLDGRWRFWGPQAARFGWLSVLSVNLADGDTFGSLNLYSRQIASFGQSDLAVAEAFAGHAGVALAAVRERRSGSEAAKARRQVGRAQDIVMGRLGVDAEQAFAVLRRNASRSNRKVSDAAADVVAGRWLPEHPSAQSEKESANGSAQSANSSSSCSSLVPASHG